MDEATRRRILRRMAALFDDRRDAGRQLAAALEGRQLGDAVVVGLARGGIPVAAEVADRLSLPLDALAVRKIRHPWQLEYGLGAVTPGRNGVYLRSHGFPDDSELRRAIARAKAKADRLDSILHHRLGALDVRGRTVVLVDDGLATGGTMEAAVRWARTEGARHIVVAVPVGAAESLRCLRHEADEVVCPHARENLEAVGLWYDVFTQVGDDEAVALLERRRACGPILSAP